MFDYSDYPITCINDKTFMFFGLVGTFYNERAVSETGIGDSKMKVTALLNVFFLTAVNIYSSLGQGRCSVDYDCHLDNPCCVSGSCSVSEATPTKATTSLPIINLAVQGKASQSSTSSDRKAA